MSENLIELRPGVLRVKLVNRRDNTHYYDPLSRIVLNPSKPMSDNLNEVLYTKDMQETQVSLKNIIQAISTNTLEVTEGVIPPEESKIDRPAPYILPGWATVRSSEAIEEETRKKARKSCNIAMYDTSKMSIPSKSSRKR